MAEYADYHHAMAQHLSNTNQINQLHPAIGQIPMLSAAGLNLTVSSGNQVMACGLSNTSAGQHHLGQVSASGHHGMYQNVQTNSGGSGGNAGNVMHQQGNQNVAHHHHGSSKKQKKPKVNKDGVPAPKRATTAYINFTQWYREELKKSGRTIPKIGEFGKECANKWNNMNEEEKSPFLNVAAKDRERYKKEMAVYKPARDANKPKRPGTAFMLFMGDFRKEMAGKEPEGGVAALAKLGGERWRNMTEEEKRPYVEKQNEEKVRYEVCMEDYRRKSAGMTGGPSPKQARLSTEGSEGGSPVDSDSGGGNSGDQNCGQLSGNNQEQDQHQAQNMVVRRHQNVSTPSPAASSSSPQAQQTMSPSPLSGSNMQQQSQQQQSQQQSQAQSISNNNSNNANNSSNNNNGNNSNNMASLPPLSTAMSLSHAITNHTLMAGYSQHSFAPNFGHPGAAGVLAAGAAAAAAANYNQAHSGNMTTGNSPSYLPTGASGTYPAQSHLPGHYTWN